MKEKTVFLQITDQYVIKSDDYNWMLCRPRGKDPKTGGIKWQPFVYCGSLSQIVEATGQYMLRTSGARTYAELVKAADEISRLLSQKFTASASITISPENK